MLRARGVPALAGPLAAAERALHVDGALARARLAFAEAFAVAEDRGDGEALARAALGMGGLWVHERRSAVDAATVESCQRRALDAVDCDSVLALRLRIRLGAESDYREGRVREVLRGLHQARRADDPTALAEALSLAHHCVLGPEHPRLRLALAEELIRVGARTGRPSDTVMGLLWRTVDLFLAGDRRAERALADLVGHPATAANAAASYAVDSLRVMLTIRSGRLAEAEALAESTARAGAAAGDTDWMGWYCAQLLTIRWFQGRLAELTDTVAGIVDSPTLSVVDHSFVAAQAAVCAAAAQPRQARGALARLTGRDLAELPSSSSWLAAMTAVVEACAMLDDAATAARVRDLLAPHAELPVMASLAVSCLGSVQHPLGVASLVCGDHDRAVDHLQAAVEHNSALGHWPALTLSRHRLAQALLARHLPGDARAGTRLLAEAAAEAAEWGMRLPDATTHRARSTPPAAVCCRRGRRWRVELAGRSAVIEDMVGLHHLARLLANPDVDIPALDLAAPQHPPTGGSRQPVLDEEAKARYRSRLASLAEELGEATRRGDRQRAQAARTESDWITRELRAATGPGGRSRPFADDAERARVAVGKAIRRALDRIGQADAVLGEQLRAGVQTGTTCCYRPGG